MKVFKLIGNSLSHSISPEIHNYTYTLLGLDAKYELFECNESKLKDFLKAEVFKNISCQGMNVTIPYKEHVLEYLDDINKDAKIIGAVNTIKKCNDKLIGYNTDYYGIDKTLDKSIVCNNIHLILGTGGACKPIIHYLLNNGSKCIYIASRNPKNTVLNLDNDYKTKIKIIGYDEIKNIKGVYIINATPVGTYPKIHESPVDESILCNFTHAFDLTYNPYETLFLKYAKKRGLSVHNGLKMLVYQALRAIEIWNNFKISDCVKKEIYDYFDNINNDKYANIYLVGITGVGKTTLGKKLANALGYNFLDTDEEIERITKKSISSIFAEGEDEFRKIENKVLLSTLNLNNTVISTGGGIVTLEENRNFLKLYDVFYLCRDIEEIIKTIDTENRPLLKNNRHKIYSLFDERKKYYEEVSSYIINNTDIEYSVNEIVKIIKNEK